MYQNISIWTLDGREGTHQHHPTPDKEKERVFDSKSVK